MAEIQNTHARLREAGKTDPLAGGIDRRRTQGHVVNCDGRRAVIMARVDDNVIHMENHWAVGQLITIREGENRVVGQTFHVESTGSAWAEAGVNTLLVHIELVGEIHQRGDGTVSFSSGIGSYPKMGAVAHRIRAVDLEAIYQNDADTTITIGNLAQDTGIPAKIDLEKLTSRHFAIVGSTGTGKSTSVSLMIHKIIDRRPDLRVLILDPHNEFSSAFPTRSVVKNARSLNIPFWLFTFEEFREIVFRGQKGLEPEAELLRDLIAEAKHRYEADSRSTPGLTRRGASANGYTADSPVPYRMIDLFKAIDERLGQLEGKAVKPTLKSLRDRLVSISADPRFGFTFASPNAGGDRMGEIVADLFRVPHNDRPVTVIDMSELPSEVINSVASVLCRMAFDLAVASQGGIQTLVICEEAHRYIPADREAGFWPTRQAVARIAKEGRKYGVYLGIVTQRPGELDPTILSQCNTIFAMRLSNLNDQTIIGDAMTNGAQTSINFISSLADRECIAFGEALKTPMRMIFETIGAECLPGSRIQEMQQAVRKGRNVDLESVIRRMREADSATGEDEASFVDMAGQLPQREVGAATDDGLSSLAGDALRQQPGAGEQQTSLPHAGPAGHETDISAGPRPTAALHRLGDDAFSVERQMRRREERHNEAPSASTRQTKGTSLVHSFRSRH